MSNDSPDLEVSVEKTEEKFIFKWTEETVQSQNLQGEEVTLTQERKIEIPKNEEIASEIVKTLGDDPRVESGHEAAQNVEMPVAYTLWECSCCGIVRETEAEITSHLGEEENYDERPIEIPLTEVSDAEEAIRQREQQVRREILNTLRMMQENFQHRVDVALEEKEDAEEDSWTEKRSIIRINSYDLAQTKIQELCEDLESFKHSADSSGNLQQEEEVDTP
jgi:hypothetical protein